MHCFRCEGLVEGTKSAVRRARPGCQRSCGFSITGLAFRYYSHLRSATNGVLQRYQAVGMAWPVSHHKQGDTGPELKAENQCTSTRRPVPE